jgi:DNA-binding winged helix-turn-helix (wHTH) protein
MDAPRPADERVFNFGSFELYPARRLLVKDGVTVKIGGRAFDLLIILVENAGRIVAKQELITGVWGKLIVVDTNIRVHVASLRRVLGDNRYDCRYIVHVARRGYIFVAARSGSSEVAAIDVSLGTTLPGAAGQADGDLRPERHPGPRPPPTSAARFDRNGPRD